MLPPELINIIPDPPCKIRTNGKISSNLRIIIRTECLPSSCQGEVVQWVLRCLEDKRLEHIKDEVGQYPWHVVSNVVNEQEGVELEEDGAHFDPPRYPELVVAVRIGQVRDAYEHHDCDDDHLVVVDENAPCPELEVNADVFKEIVRGVPPPPFITAVGVSAVSDEFMMRLWSEIISPIPNTLDGQGKGYMCHPMWKRERFENKKWNAIRETSCIFGWKGYNAVLRYHGFIQ
tara:strand:+ start:1796 stop:2491 length:696 start_codon:yes stop_codon:yes gene_type:complete